MSTKLLMAAIVATFSFGAAQAQDAPINDAQTTAQSQTNAISSSTDDTAYGGTRAKGDSGSMSVTGRPRLQDCVGPVSFCDIYKGQ